MIFVPTIDGDSSRYLYNIVVTESSLRTPVAPRLNEDMLGGTMVNGDLANSMTAKELCSTLLTFVVSARLSSPHSGKAERLSRAFRSLSCKDARPENPLPSRAKTCAVSP